MSLRKRVSAPSVMGLAFLGVIGTACLATAALKVSVDGDDQAIDGIWRSHGYGWLWQIDGKDVSRFDIGKGFCIPSLSAGTNLLGAENRAQLSPDGQTLRIRQDDPDYFYSFERVAKLPASCAKAPPADPLSVFDIAAENIATHYMFFKEREVDWNGLATEARARLNAQTDNADLFSMFIRVLMPFGDSHVGINAEVDGEAESISLPDPRARTEPSDAPIIPGSWNTSVAETLLGKSARRYGDDETLSFGFVAKGIGFLEIASMEGMQPAELETALDQAMKTFDDAKAVIVDVSRNDGGLDSFARSIARRFAAEPTVAYSKYAGDFAGDRPQTIALTPADGPRYVGPVYVVTGSRTVSAGEIFTMAMRALPNVVHIGGTTDGSLSDELWKTLPNGWLVSLSNEVYLDSDGKLWEGKGIPPELRLAVSYDDEVTEKEKRSVRDAIAFIAKQLK